MVEHAFDALYNNEDFIWLCLLPHRIFANRFDRICAVCAPFNKSLTMATSAMRHLFAPLDRSFFDRQQPNDGLTFLPPECRMNEHCQQSV